MVGKAADTPATGRLAPHVRRELYGTALMLFAVFLAGALVVHGASRSIGGRCGSAGGFFGPVGACLRVGMLTLVGLPTAVLLPLIPAVHALRLFGRLRQAADRSWLIFLIGVVLVLPVGIALAFGARPDVEPAGLWGSLAAYYLARGFGPVGAWIVVVLAVSALMAATLAWNPLRLIVGHPPAPGAHGSTLHAAHAASNGRRPLALADALAPSAGEMPAVDPAEGTPTEGAPARKRRTGRVPSPEERAGDVAAEIHGTADVPEGAGDELPPTDLLTPIPPRQTDVSKRELDAMGAKLLDALRTFRVEGELVGRTTGPVVTQFEVVPAAGVKVRQIATLADDLALAMRAPSIRIVAPIPGRGAVGVEVPNPTAEVVWLREVIESREFQHARAALPIVLGKDLEGLPVVADLAKMPHLLIAGATGSGKSVCVNALITSLVYRHNPETLRFLMVDPKMVELSVYNTLPHLRHKVITDNRDAAAVLKWALMEMQERYELLAANGCRNMQEFNERVRDGASLLNPKTPDVAFEERAYSGKVLPYIVVVIDELADLIMTVQGEVETPLALLAQKARAVGIHLILATQRPSVNVITGLIKANFPSRIAFRVASQVDSRTILDGVGAEALLGNGDMLFIPPGKSEPARLQGAYITGDDTERLIRWYDAKREARRSVRAGEAAAAASVEDDILETVRRREAERESEDDADSSSSGVGGDRDQLFREAAEVVIQHQHGSTSLLQRRLKIGYGRAARVMDQLQAAGVLAPQDGSKPRDVLVGLEDLDRICR
jgi:S-DNA-T family DNA segregation ATPase FtsK/SpoIIIE